MLHPRSHLLHIQGGSSTEAQKQIAATGIYITQVATAVWVALGTTYRGVSLDLFDCLPKLWEGSTRAQPTQIVDIDVWAMFRPSKHHCIRNSPSFFFFASIQGFPMHYRTSGSFCAFHTISGEMSPMSRKFMPLPCHVALSSCRVQLQAAEAAAAAVWPLQGQQARSGFGQHSATQIQLCPAHVS